MPYIHTTCSFVNTLTKITQLRVASLQEVSIKAAVTCSVPLAYRHLFSMPRDLPLGKKAAYCICFIDGKISPFLKIKNDLLILRAEKESQLC